MLITIQQFEEAAQGKVVEIEEDNTRFVLISRNLFERLSNLSYEELDPEKTYGPVLEAWDSVGSPYDATDYL